MWRRPGSVSALAILLLAAACRDGGAPDARAVPGRPDDDLLRDPVLQEVVDLQVARRGGALAARLHHPDPRVRSRAAFALGSVRDPAARPALVEALRDPAPVVRRDVAWALGQGEEGEDAASALKDALAVEGDEGVRRSLIEAIGRVGGEEAVEALASLRDPRNEDAVALALSRAVLRDRFVPAALDRLAAGLTHPEPQVRIHSAYVFGRLDRPEVWERHLERVRSVLAAYDRDDPAAIHLLRALTRADPSSALPLFASYYGESRDWRIRQHAVEGLAAGAGEEGLARLREVSTGDASGHVRAVAAALLEELSPGTTDPAAEEGVGEEEGEEDPEDRRPGDGGASPALRELDGHLGRSVSWLHLRAVGPHPLLHLQTGQGSVMVRLDAVEAPMTVQTVAALAEAGHYDDTPFHRVVPDFVIQGGDVADGTGEGGPGFSIRTESTRIPFRRGVIGMASDGRDTEGSQFFITHSMQPHLDGGYTAFGYVVEGMDVVDRIQQGDRVVRARIEPGR